MLFEIPKTTRILGVDVPTVWKKQIVETDGKVCQGMAEYTVNEIWLDENMPETQKCHTYFHEIVHHVANSLGMEMEEEEVLRLSRGLWAVLVDNGLLKESKDEDSN